MAYRSEANRIPNKINYTDLNLTHYPSQIDTRLNNTNMRGFVNVGEESIPDYVMAEYVNAAIDAVMALQRAVGVNPMVPTNTPTNQINTVIENRTISDRIAAIEGGDLDERYGGPSWRYVPNRPTLSNHNHTGTNGHPNKISLINEVTGLLNKQNIDLRINTGLTGSDIFVSNTKNVYISDAINDMLSKTFGGTVLAKTNFNKGIRSLTNIELLAAEFQNKSGVSNITDNAANFKSAVTVNSAAAATFHKESLTNNLLFGSYVLGVRVKTDNLLNANVLRLQTGSQSTIFKGNEFKAANKYQILYHVFDHDTVEDLTISKLSTSSAISLTIDSFFVQPIHPTVFDR